MASLRSIDLKQLRYFIGIVDAGSITRAAQVLNVAQPALTNRMKALEDSLCVKVLYRSPSGVTPTAEGKILYRSAKRILGELETVAEEVRALGSSPAGTVRFACAFSTARILANPLATTVLSQLPFVRFSLAEATSLDTYRRIQQSEADLALLFQDGPLPGLVSEPLLKEEMFIVVSAQSSRFKDKEYITFDEIEQLRFFMASPPKNFGAAFLHEKFSQAAIQLKVVSEIQSIAGIIELVVSQDAATILPWAGVHEYLESGSVRLLKVDGVPLMRWLAMCRPADRPPTPAVEAVARIATEQITALVRSGRWKNVELRSDSNHMPAA